MIPDNLSGLLIFLVFLAPGAYWEIRRTKFEPSIKETPVQEVARLVLASTVATFLAALGLALLSTIPVLIWASCARGFHAPLGFLQSLAQLPAVTEALAALVFVASLAGVHIVTSRKWGSDGPIRNGDTWHQAFVGLPARGESIAAPLLFVELIDGTVWRGSLLCFDNGPEDVDRSLALGSPIDRKRVGASEFTDREVGAVVIRESQMRSVQVIVTNQTENLESTQPLRSPLSTQ